MESDQDFFLNLRMLLMFGSGDLIQPKRGHGLGRLKRPSLIQTGALLNLIIIMIIKTL